MYKAQFYHNQLKAKYQVEVRFTLNGLEITCTEFVQQYSLIDVYSIDEKDQGVVLVKLGHDFPFSVLEIANMQFKEALLRKCPQVRHHKNIESKGYVFIFSTLLVGMFLLLGLVAWSLPWLGEQAAMLMPTTAEVKMGDALYNSYKSDFKIDTFKTQQANKIFKFVDFGKTYPIEITVVKDDVLNAFALPGGHIVVYDKLLKTLETPEEFVALMSHESSHVNLRHSTRMIGRNAATTLLFSWFLGEYGSLSGIGQKFLGLSYSREYETEADKVGVELMFKNKVNPEGMVLLLNKLKEGHNEGNSNKVDKYFLTHPLSSERIEAVKKLIVLQKDTNLFVTSPDLLKYWTELKK